MLRRHPKSPASPATYASYKRPRVEDVQRFSPAESRLEKLLSENGHCRLNHDHGPHIITNPHQLVGHLDRRLRADPEQLKLFMHDLSTLFEDDSAFRKALQPYAESPHSERSSLAAGHNTDSLVKVLLRVPSLQEHVSDAILQKFLEFSAEQDSSSLHTDIPRLIIHQLRFLDNLYNETRLCEKLLELYSASQTSFKKEILAAIPDIFSDASHPRIVQALESELQEDTQLIVNILDTLSNLGLQGEMMEKERKIASTALDTASVSALPIVIRFMMQSSTKSDADKTVEVILRKLQSLGKPQNESSKTSTDDFLLVLDQLRIGYSYHKHIALAMTKRLQGIESSDLTPVVIWTVFMLNDQSAYSTRIVKIVRKWVSSDHRGILPHTFEEVISRHFEAINLVPKSILSLAEEMTSTSDIREQNLGEALYRNAFLRFASRTDVLAGLANHIGSGRNHEIDRGLQVLLQLCTHSPSEVSPYFAYLLGLLDYCHNMTSFQLRTLFKALASCHNISNGNVLKSDVINYITKNLQHSSVSFQRPAIIGALCFINANVLPDQHFPDDHPVYPLFVDLDRQTSKSHVATALLCEEILFYLSRNEIHQEVTGGLIKRIIELFQNTFLITTDKMPTGGNFEVIEVVPMFSLDPKESEHILAIYPGLADPSRRSSFIMLPTVLELLNRWSLCDAEAVPDEDEFSSIPLALFNFECIKSIDNDASLLTLMFSAILHAINWFRALLNAFVSCDDNVLRGKCCKRLSQILELQCQLCRFPSDFLLEVVPFAISQAQRCILSAQKDIKGRKWANDIVQHRIDPLLRPFSPTVYRMLTIEAKLELSSNEVADNSATLYLDTFHYLLTEFNETLRRYSPKSSPFKSHHVEPPTMVEHLDICQFFSALNYDSNFKGSEPRVFRALGKSLLLLTSRESADCEHSSQISRNVDLILQSLELILHCSALKSPQGHSILQMIILDFVQSDFADKNKVGFPTCLSVLGHFLLDLLPLPGSSIATQTKICTIVNDLQTHGPIQNLDLLTSKLSGCAFKLLSEFWRDDYSLDVSVGILIVYHMKNSAEPLEVVKQLILSDFPQFFDRHRRIEDAEENDPPAFSKTLALKTWPYFFKACAEQISASMNDLERDISSLLRKLDDCAKLFSSLLEFVKRSQKPVILGSALRSGQAFMDRIVNHIPLMKSSFNENKKEITTLIMSVQKVTRFLQRTCSHVKREKISNLTRLVPPLKKTIEKNMYLIKDLFFHYNMMHSTDFKCAALKNRTIDGRELQEEEEEQEEEEQDEENEPEDVEEEESREETNTSEPDDDDASDAPSEFHC